MKTANALLKLLLVLVVSGCASIDFDYPRPESVAVSTTLDTYLGRKARALASGRPSDESGFFMLSDGIDALAMRLHTKAFVIDRKKVFFGSFNFDPRSSYLNTEVGVIIESAAMAEDFDQKVEGALATRRYEVYLDDKDRLRWRSRRG